MYVGYLLDKESGMYHQGPVRRSSINLPPQNFVSTPQYPDFTGYHHVPNMDTHAQSSGSWGPSYGAPREDWGAYSLGPPNTIPTPMNNSSPGQVPYCSSEYSHMHPPGAAVLQPPPENVNVGQLSPDRERRNSFQWMSKTAQSSSTGESISFVSKNVVIRFCFRCLFFLQQSPQKMLFFFFFFCPRKNVWFPEDFTHTSEICFFLKFQLV